MMICNTTTVHAAEGSPLIWPLALALGLLLVVAVVELAFGPPTEHEWMM